MRYAITLIVALAICSQAFATKPVKRLLIVEESQQAEANAAAVAVFGPKARDTFSVQMENTEKKVYYVCSWRLTDEDASRLVVALDAVHGPKVKVFKKAKENPKADEFTSARAKLKELEITKVNADRKAVSK